MSKQKLNLAFLNILNASCSLQSKVQISYTKLNLNLTFLLYKQGFIRGFSYNKYYIVIYLKYCENLKPIIKNLKTLSTGGRNVFICHKTLAASLKNKGIFIISTTKGLITSNKALNKYKVGGEVLAKII